ncbi:syntaxin binding protein 1 [Coemansia javaensis]|uniref:Syntaxin binding protein 1 n=1 Tax=Coemansia javaensis TaxID=2761396 RepID=A0A9W8LIZ2_9FUNG|nr:syntaxin binding protein 1 [Coemansia javaensis]
MREVLAELPDFKRLQDSYSLHIDLASKCLEIINRGGLTVLSDFEQDLIAGKSAWGEPVDQESLEARLIALLDDRTLDSSDRVRILFLYLVHIGGGSALDRRRLSEVPQCLTINDKRAAVNLRRLGGDDEAAMGPEPDRYSWNSTAPTSTAEKRSLLEPADHLSGRLDPKLFPWTAEPPAAEAAAEAEEATRWSPSLNVRSLRRDRGTLRNRKPRHKFGGSTGGVVIVYIAGGVTFAEMRSVYELAESLGREIYIGSTHVITPRGFLDDMKSLHLELLQ